MRAFQRWHGLWQYLRVFRVTLTVVGCLSLWQIGGWYSIGILICNMQREVAIYLLLPLFQQQTGQCTSLAIWTFCVASKCIWLMKTSLSSAKIYIKKNMNKHKHLDLKNVAQLQFFYLLVLKTNPAEWLNKPSCPTPPPAYCIWARLSESNLFCRDIRTIKNWS